MAKSFRWIFIFADISIASILHCLCHAHSFIFQLRGLTPLYYFNFMTLLTHKNSVTHHIRTTEPTVFCRPRRLAPDHLQVTRSEFEHMLQLGVVRPSQSPWSSSLHMVLKSSHWDLCPCCDYRSLNKITIPDRYPIPQSQDFTSRWNCFFQGWPLMRLSSDSYTPWWCFKDRHCNAIRSLRIPLCAIQDFPQPKFHSRTSWISRPYQFPPLFHSTLRSPSTTFDRSYHQTRHRNTAHA